MTRTGSNNHDQSALSDLRRRQISSLLECFSGSGGSARGGQATSPFHSIQEVVPSATYHLYLHPPPFYLILWLSPSFPESPPILQFQPPSQHPWIHPETGHVCGHAGLTHWSLHTSLGRIVQEIAQEFAQRPPVLLVVLPSIPTPTITREGIPVSTRSTSPVGTRSIQESPTLAPPSIPPAPRDIELSGLESKTLPELALLIANADALDEWMELNVDFVKNTLEVEEELWSSLEMDAKQNLEREVARRRDQVASVKVELELMNSKKVEYDEKVQTYRDLLAKFQPNAMSIRLGEEIRELEAASEAMFHAFITTGKGASDDEGGVDEMLARFRQDRMEIHLRCAKLEHLRNIQLT